MADNDNKHLVQRQFGQNPEEYVSSAVHALSTDLARLLELTAPHSEWRLLDIATGGGHTARTFSPHVRQIIAADLTLSMLQAARRDHSAKQLHNIAYEQADAEALPFATKSFDLVACRIAAHHFPDPQRFLSEAYRVTKPGGLIVLVDQIMPKNRKAARYTNAFERLRDPSHAWAYSLPRWDGMFKAVGLVVEHTETFRQRHVFSDWAGRMKCPPDVMIRLRAMLIHAPEKAAAWLEAEIPPGGDPSFLIHQGILLGRKP